MRFISHDAAYYGGFFVKLYLKVPVSMIDRFSAKASFQHTNDTDQTLRKERILNQKSLILIGIISRYFSSLNGMKLFCYDFPMFLQLVYMSKFREKEG